MSVQVTNMAADQQKPSVRDKKKSRKSCLSSLLSSTVMLGNMSSVLSLSVGSKTVILSNEGLSQHQIMGSLQGAVKILCRLLDHFLSLVSVEEKHHKTPSLEETSAKCLRWTKLYQHVSFLTGNRKVSKKELDNYYPAGYEWNFVVGLFKSGGIFSVLCLDIFTKSPSSRSSGLFYDDILRLLLCITAKHDSY